MTETVSVQKDQQQKQQQREKEGKGEEEGERKTATEFKPFAEYVVEGTSYEWSDTENFENSFTLVGRNTYVIGLESGRFDGRWNGVWSLPIKIADRVHFSITDGVKIYQLSDYVQRFDTKISHVERTYYVPELQTKIWELMFIPEDNQSVCWRFLIRQERINERAKRLRLLANCLFNLMWEMKQAGELYKVRKEILLFDENNSSVIARHYRHADWIGIFGASRHPSRKCLGFDDAASLPTSDVIPKTDRPCYGNVLLEYKIDEPEDSADYPLFEIDFCLTGGSLSNLEALREYNQVLVNLQLLMLDKSYRYEEFLRNTTAMSHPVTDLARAFVWSKVNLHMLEHSQPGFGTGFFAGLPHFAIYFGRDTCWTSFGALSIGDFSGARESLNLLARFQAASNGEDQLREPYYRGEIPHEIRTEGTVYYYSVDATPLFVIACKNYFDWTKDLNFIKFTYDNIIRAIEWGLDADRDGDGLIEHGPEGFLIDTTWMDSYYRGKSAVDVQAIMCRALYDAAHLAKILEDDSRMREWTARADALRENIIERYWNSKTRFFYDTISPDGKQDSSLTINSVVPVLFRLTTSEMADAVLSRVEADAFMTDWGVRTRSRDDPQYDPRSYQKGGVWPFCTGWVTRAEFDYERYNEGFENFRRFVKGLGMGSNYFKEVLYGDLPPTGSLPVQPTGCFIQAWSASMFLSSVVEGLFGVSPFDSLEPRLRVLPYIRQDWGDVQLNNIHVKDNRFQFRIRSKGKEVMLKIRNDGPDVCDVETGFVMPANLSEARISPVASSSAAFENLTQRRVRGCLRVSLSTRLKEDESREFQFLLS
jgi:hypothetical protein